MRFDDKDDEFELPDFEDDSGGDDEGGASSGDDLGGGFEDASSGEGAGSEDDFGESFDEDTTMDSPSLDAQESEGYSESGSEESADDTLSPSQEQGKDDYTASIFSSGMSEESGDKPTGDDYEESSTDDMYDYGNLDDKEESSGGKSKVFITLIAIMCVVFVGLGGTYLWLKSKNKDDTMLSEAESSGLGIIDTLSEESSDTTSLAMSGIGSSSTDDLASAPSLLPSEDASSSPPVKPAPSTSPQYTPPSTPPAVTTTPSSTRAVRRSASRGRAGGYASSRRRSSGTAGNLEVLTSETGRAYIIVASYSNRAAAMRHGRRLADQGQQVQIISPYSNWRYYRVALADYSTYREAARQLRRYRNEFGSDVWVLPYR